nr:MAG TPA: hypothetical protein [Caudoviricetes sp.]
MAVTDLDRSVFVNAETNVLLMETHLEPEIQKVADV